MHHKFQYDQMMEKKRLKRQAKGLGDIGGQQKDAMGVAHNYNFVDDPHLDSGR